MEFLQDHPFAFVIVLVMGAVIGMAVERFVETQDREKRKAYWRGRNAGKGFGRGFGKGKSAPASSTAAISQQNPADVAADQLKTVMAAKFTPRPLLNRPEAAVFAALDKAVIARNPKWQEIGREHV